MEHLDNDGINNLIVGVVKRAAQDYRIARNILDYRPYDYTATRVMHEVYKFFTGGWFDTLTGMDGGAIWDRLEAEDNDEDAMSFYGDINSTVRHDAVNEPTQNVCNQMWIKGYQI